MNILPGSISNKVSARMLTLDFTGVDTKEELHRYIAAKLSFPKWYGRNLDALYDMLTSMGIPTTLFLRDVHALAENLGEYGETAVQVFAAAAAENPRLQLRWEDGHEPGQL